MDAITLINDLLGSARTWQWILLIVSAMYLLILMTAVKARLAITAMRTRTTGILLAGLCTKASNHKPVTTRLVRRHLWMSPGGFSMSRRDSDSEKVPAALYDRLTDTPTYAARMYKVQPGVGPDSPEQLLPRHVVDLVDLPVEASFLSFQPEQVVSD